MCYVFKNLRVISNGSRSPQSKGQWGAYESSYHYFVYMVGGKKVQAAVL